MSYQSSYTGAQIEAAIATVQMFTGVNNVTTLASLPVDKCLIRATLSAATDLSFASTPPIGVPIHVICKTTAAFTQAIPNTGSWVSMSGSSLAVTAYTPFELDIIYDGSNYRIVVLTQS